jgi:predicted DNA-binding mobile mystery protein A
MNDAIRHLDKRFESLRPLAAVTRPQKGWVRAIRDALGMTAAQLGKRLGVSQPRISKLEQFEVEGNITLESLQRAAEALGCKLVYALVPERPLAETVRARAETIAAKRSRAIEHTMKLEDQAVTDSDAARELREARVEELLRRPSRLWDEP